MRISRLMMPAVTLAGALALAGCGGSGTTADTDDDDDDDNPPITCTAPGVKLADGKCVRDEDYVDPEAASKERTADATALMKALGVNLPSGSNVTATSIPVGSDASTSPVISDLKKTSATVAALAGWQGAHYEGDNGKTGDDKITGEVRAYSNKAAAEQVSFGDVYTPIADQAYYTLSAGGSGNGFLAWNSDKIAGSDFPTNGTEELGPVVKFTGTYDGASGTYTCTHATNCTATADGGKITGLSGAWRFTPTASQTASKAAEKYLEFGWWVRKGKDGPIDAGAFANGAKVSEDPENATSVIGSATYKGGAAGKFAISNPARPQNDNSGHFTADATLEANFTKDMLKGTINNFTLNDTVKGDWVVSLEESTIAVAGIVGGETSITDRGSETRWSLDGTNFGAKGGDWQASFYEDEDDDNNIPDSVIGTFEAGLGGGTHHMEGAFGASQE